MEYCKEIIENEKSRCYREAAVLSYRLWEDSKSNEDLLKASLELWYVLFCDVRMGQNLSQDREIMFLWKATSEELKAKWKESYDLMFFFGYMLKVGFYLFIDVIDDVKPDNLSDYGVSLMEKAYGLQPDNPIFRIQHLRDAYGFSKNRECVSISIEYGETIKSYFAGDGLICRYFRSIYCVDNPA